MKHELPCLYKKDNSGNIIIWKIYTEYEEVHTIHGRLDGQQQHDIYVAEEKNIGRSNYRDETEQAIEEATAKWTKQIKYNGYFESIEKAKNSDKFSMPSGGIKPMKAHKWTEQKHKLKYPLLVQPKIDGMRCIAVCTLSTDGKNSIGIDLFASSGRPIKGMEHIKNDLVCIMEPGEIWDGELYCHGMPLNQILGIVKSEKNPKPIEIQKQIQYHIFDAIRINTLDENNTFYSRHFDLSYRLTSNKRDSLILVTTISVKNEDEAYIMYVAFCNEGYEGLMYRNEQSPYEQKRSYNIQKRKDFQEEEFEIIGVEDGKGRAEGLAINFVCKCADTRMPTAEGIFSVPINGTEEYRTTLFNDETLWKGKYATVRFLNFSEYMVPIIPKCIAIRDEIGLD